VLGDMQNPAEGLVGRTGRKEGRKEGRKKRKEKKRKKERKKERRREREKELLVTNLLYQYFNKNSQKQ
jgi:hypothetical protein